jgi:hypothetical protein
MKTGNEASMPARFLTKAMRKHACITQEYYCASSILFACTRKTPAYLSTAHVVHHMLMSAGTRCRCLSEPRLEEINYIQTPTALLTAILCEAIVYFFSSAFSGLGAEAPVFILARRPTQGTVSTATYWVKPSVC